MVRGRPFGHWSHVVHLRHTDVSETQGVAHAVALAAGGSDEGAPGLRGDDGPYCAYFHDPEGNKFLVYRKGPDEV